MSRKQRLRSDVEHRLTEKLGRRLSARTLLFHQAVAARLGLHPTDLKCLDLARTEPELTAGRIAELTGLTTAAVTSVLDRLERAGLAQRVRDAADRRKVLVRPVEERAREVEGLFASLDAAMRKLYAEYSVRDLALIEEFAGKLDRLMEEETTRVRDAAGLDVSPTASASRARR
ncbi:MAG: MarR family transcriptional regulator [Terracidiphilus sp.]